MQTIMLKGKAIELTSSLSVGDHFLPGFTLIDSDLNPFSSDQMGTISGLVYFAPSLDTPVCALSTQKLIVAAKKYPSKQFLVITVDTPFAFKRLCASSEFAGQPNVKLLSTLPSPHFLMAHGLMIQSFPLKGVAARAIFVVDQGRIVHGEIVEELSHEPDYEAAFAHLTKS